MTKHPPYVAIALLTQQDLDALGASFRRAIPITDDTDFDELLKTIDEATRHPSEA